MHYGHFARANAKSGIISNDEFTEIERGLREVLKEWEADTFVIMPNDEDRLGQIHTANERRLSEIIGKEIGGKLHTGRSRNEQVVTDMRMWLRERIREIEGHLAAFLQVIAARAEAEVPLGVGALAGNAFGIDRQMMAKELGFEGIMWNSMGAVADLLGLGYHKKIPDGLELLRGKAGRGFGHFAGVYCATKGIPSTYNKDLQESWEPMLDHVKTVSDSVQIANGILSTLKLRPDRMRASLNPLLLATDVADALVKIGVPFRETHHISGRVVAKSEELGIPMDQLSLEQLQAIDSRFPDNIKDVFNYEASVESRNAQGGTSRASVLEQIEVLKGMLG
ncbi:unnamed protein product [Clonostachys solani]|uniref:Argininosuccinate lyase n=1 Tax=Clonostachys solani TaxID=160281 RepID=A0A9N9YVH1_9HYPO|nr:unnamed protein product [Clonostachys solani]